VLLLNRRSGTGSGKQGPAPRARQTGSFQAASHVHFKFLRAHRSSVIAQSTASGSLPDFEALLLFHLQVRHNILGRADWEYFGRGFEERIQARPHISKNGHTARSRFKEPDTGGIPGANHVLTREVQSKLL